MPTVHREGGLRFFFYSNEGLGVREPAHMHVVLGNGRSQKDAKFWLDPVRLQDKGDLRRPDLVRARKIIDDHEAEFLEAWRHHFG
jgi:Domain of unknown function (DUF4160)